MRSATLDNLKRTDGNLIQMSPSALPFEVAGGSVIGRDHVFLGKNNQDAFGWIQDESCTAAVLCDGCGSGPHSEVGAKLLVPLVLASLRGSALAFENEPAENVLRRVRREVLRKLNEMVRALGKLRRPRAEIIESYFLSTILGTFLGRTRGVLFSLGDGILGLNGDFKRLPALENAPPYLAYGLLSRKRKAVPPGLCFQVQAEADIGRFENVLLASDGLDPLLLQDPDKDRLESGQDLRAALLANDAIFRNPQGLTRRLNKWNMETKRIDWEARRVHKKPGLFRDDATVIVIRKRRNQRALQSGWKKSDPQPRGSKRGAR